MNSHTPYRSIADIGPQIGDVIARHIDQAFRCVLRGPMVHAERRFIRLITREPHPFGNVVIVTEPDDALGIEEAIKPLMACGAPSAVLFPRSVDPTLESLLHRFEFHPHEGMPAMAVEIDALQPTQLPADYSLSRVGCGAAGEAWAAAFSRGYELPHGVGAAFSPNATGTTTAAHAPIQYFAVYRDGRPVCTSLAYLEHGVAGIYCVSTVPEERGKGLAAHATAEPLRHARELGYRVGVLQSSTAGHSVYLRLGFTDFGMLPLYVRGPS